MTEETSGRKRELSCVPLIETVRAVSIVARPMKMQPVSITRRKRNEALTALIARAPLEFTDVDGYAELTKGQRLQLCRDLLKAKEHFEFRKRVKESPEQSAAISLLKEYEKSIGRVAYFGRLALDSLKLDSDGNPDRPATALGGKARRLLDEAGERWACDQIEAGADLPEGFTPRELVPGFTHYGADDFIESFLRAARVMQSIIKLAQSPPAKRGFEGRAVNFQNSLADWLAGEKLPEIYRNTFGLPFTATPKSAHHSDSSDGIKFVRAACRALELIELAQMSDRTIKAHYRNARKGSSLGAD
jgi:hypothetical protein